MSARHLRVAACALPCWTPELRSGRRGQVVFSLAELDPDLTGNDVIVADTIDGKPLFGYQGPMRLVAPKDARPARAVRMLQRLEVVRLKN